MNKAFSLALKAFSLALLVGGVVLVIFGISALQSLASSISVSSFFTGLPPTGKVIWMLVGGVVLSIVGLVGLLRGPKATK
jgi:hypothetical protein